ncbi:amino acid adenylation domain-containing protein [Myxosarcina sp. GI1]|uniref:thioesterase domain-containing protein n=1 Tax=Myxosarcina sp. GI1 TaxID=1541065 RepID=UPI00055E73A2|nr:amino acid adenylation domain-containing protein [Myxosarcina sp. GI1]
MLDLNDSLVHEANRIADRWRKNFAGIPPLLNFPPERARLVENNLEAKGDRYNRSKQERFIFSQKLSQAIKTVARQEDVTVSLFLLCAFQVLLYRYTARENFVVSCLSWSGDRDNRLDILPVKATIEARQKFRELLVVAKNQICEAQKYLNTSSISFDLAVKSGKTEFSPLFQILFGFNSLSAEVTSSKKLPESKFLLDITETKQHLVCSVDCDPQWFDTDTISRVGENYQVLLDSIVSSPQTSIDFLSIVSTTKRKQILNDWNQTNKEIQPQCIHQLFEAQVKQNPKAVAVICQGQRLTYGELNARANKLARYLKKLGIESGSLVGLCIERSLEMVVGVLAILKAGGAYVPLDISNPPARLAFILEDTQIEILLTQESLLAKLPTKVERAVCIDRDWQSITRQASNNLDNAVNVSDLAHIVYTSGSTGKPKGVMLTHGNLSHYAQALELAFEITPADVYLHRGSIALIVSARQLLMPLTQGATVVVVSPAEIKDPLELFKLIKRYEVSIVDHVPSFWRNCSGILDGQNSSTRSDLLDNQVRLVAAGGEQVTPEIYQYWRETFKPEVKLANIYGQTEGTGVVAMYQIPHQIDWQFRSLPVGSPIPNMKAYVLDSKLQPVPIGVAAEIHISGAGVARGYLNRPELTAKKFVDNPYVPGERLYKTGDLGRFLADGSIQFLGRIDRQVNIQGLRIELGEIEAVLAQHKLVREAAIVVRQNKLGEYLAGYIVPNADKQLTAETLKSYLQEKLPSYMIPRTFVFVDTFLLTTSGKVDYRTLSQLKLDKPSKLIDVPRDRLETEIIEMLEDISGIEPISLRDDFIELGGNSLLAARLVTEIENRYAQKISISAIFQTSTPEALAALVRQEKKTGYPKSFVPIKDGNSSLVLFGIHNLGYGLELYLPLARYLGEKINLYGLSSSFSNEPDTPHFRDIVNLAEYYTRDIQQIQPQGPYHLMGISFGGIIAFEIARRLIARGHEVKFLGLVDTYYPRSNTAFQDFSLQQRMLAHLQKVRTKGLSHVKNRIKWRLGATANNTLYWLYKIDWLRENFVDRTSRNYAQIQYIQQQREHHRVNKDYAIRPCAVKINMFRAADDIDTKLDWQKVAELGLAIEDIPGEHMEILEEPQVRVLAQKIQTALRRLTENAVNNEQ